MKEKKNIIELVIITSILLVVGTLMHFVCHWAGTTHIIGFIFPANESTFEHMKMYFYPFLAVAIYMAISRKNIGYISGYLFGGIVAMLLEIGLFYAYSVPLGTSVLWVDCLEFAITVIIGSVLGYYLNTKEGFRKLWPLFLGYAVVAIVVGSIFTVNPPDFFLFEPPHEH